MYIWAGSVYNLVTIAVECFKDGLKQIVTAIVRKIQSFIIYYIYIYDILNKKSGGNHDFRIVVMWRINLKCDFAKNQFD